MKLKGQEKNKYYFIPLVDQEKNDQEKLFQQILKK